MKLNWKCLLIKAVFSIISFFLLFYCEADTPALLLELQKHTAAGILPPILKPVKLVIAKISHFALFSGIAEITQTFLNCSFTVTAISCEV